ncbi:MAG: radical SAM protein [Nitrospirota bacterium]|nr:radical SAM protein [Nitrospirota bacterium]
MNKYTMRFLYNLLGSRSSKVAALKTLEVFRLPTYRIAIDTNNTCNLRCVMCYMSLDGYRDKINIMSMEMFESIARQIFHKTKMLDLSCSFEPFMTRNFLEYVRVARKYFNGYIGICTNALLMKEEIIYNIINEELLDEINISIDGITESTYNSIRTNGDFATLLNVLSLLKSVRNHNRKKKNPIIRINYTMLRKNVEELSGIYDFAREYDIDIVQLRHAKLTRPFADLFDESLFFHQELSDSIIEKVKKQFNRDKKITIIHPPLFSSRKPKRIGKSVCAYPWFNFIISSNGDVNLCYIGSIGSFAQNTFREMLTSELVVNSRSRLLRGKYEEFCRNCYAVSDMENVQKRSTFIREDLMPNVSVP